MESVVRYTEIMETVAMGFELLAALVLTLGLVWSMALSVHVWRRSRESRATYQALRHSFGGALLLGLEILVAADLIRTVAVEPTLENVAILGVIVLIRTFLSFSLEIEIEGVAPWRRAMLSGGHHIVDATVRARGAVPKDGEVPS